MVSKPVVEFPFVLTYEWSRVPRLYRGVVKCAASGQILWKTSWCKRRRHCEELVMEKVMRREGWN